MHDRAGQGASAFRAFLRGIPDDIAKAREDGLPVVLERDRPLAPHAQRLMDSLGVEVRIVTSTAERPFTAAEKLERLATIRDDLAENTTAAPPDLPPEFRAKVERELAAADARARAVGQEETREAKLEAIRSTLAAHPDWTHRQVADSLGMTRSALRNLLNDPDGSKQRARRERNAGTCADCGGPTDASGGRSKASLRCSTCATERARAAKKWTREAVIDAIRRFAAANGRPPYSTEWIRCDVEYGYPARSSVYRSTSKSTAPFAKWADAIEAAGFERPKVGQKRPSTSEERAPSLVAGAAGARSSGADTVDALGELRAAVLAAVNAMFDVLEKAETVAAGR